MKTPYQFQHEAIKCMTGATGYLLGDECGLGKTITAIEAAKTMGPTRVLVIAPPTLLPQWFDVIADQDPSQPIILSAGIPYIYEKIQGWVLTSYYELQKPYVLQALCTVLWDVVIIDEAHRIKNRRTGFATNVKAIPRVRSIALTGTSMEKNPADLWSILDFISPGKFGTYWSFVKRHLDVEKDYFEHWIIGGPKDPEKFAEMLRPYMIRRTKTEVAQELPPKIFVPTRVTMGAKQQKLYDIITKSKDVIVDLGDEELLIKNTLTLLLKLQQAATLPDLLTTGPVPSAKLAWLDEFVADHPDEGIVVFTKWRGVAKDVAQRLHGQYSMGGGESNYTPNNPPHVLVGTIAHMGEGLNLQWATYVVVLDASWSTIQMTQAYDRVHRIDDLRQKVIYLLTACKEDDAVYEALNNKWSEAELVYHYLKQLNMQFGTP